VDKKLSELFSSWTADPVTADGRVLAMKYHGYSDASDQVQGEYQIVSMLTGLFWEVEHSAIYKPAPRLRGVAQHFAMKQRTNQVLEALKAFEDQFEALIDLKRRRRHLKKVRRRRRHPSPGG
jgi:hypothetical protein